MFERVLVANRGEIATRVLRTLRELGIIGIAIAGPSDRDTPHTHVADVVVHLGTSGRDSPYLSVEQLIGAARRTGAEAIHPGYGFLSESPRLARACAEAGIAFIGPPVEAIVTMGDKIAAKDVVAAAGVPVVPGVHHAGMSDDALIAAAAGVGYPLLVKASAGGGGRGMRVVRAASGLPDALAAARREAKGAFGNDTLLLERFIDRPRHIEIQVLADDHGTIWGMTERECSLQRRHQKVIEESPSPVLHPLSRRRMIAAALSAARSCNYRGAGTVEFLVPAETAATPDAPFFFLEMNTRLQVEHPVTEAIHDIDLVAWQVRIAAGEHLPTRPPDARGHAIEARVYAEDPARSFLPTGGTVRSYAEPAIAGVRIDSGVHAGSQVGTDFDPLIAKVVAFAEDRPVAMARLRAALRAFRTLGVPTNNAFLQALLATDCVVAGAYDTQLIETRIDEVLAAARDPALQAAVPVVAAMAWLCAGHPATANPRSADDGAGWRLAGRAASVLHQSVEADHHRVVLVGDARAVTITVDEGKSTSVAALWRAEDRLAVTIDGVEAVWDAVQTASGWIIGRNGHMWVVAETPAVAPDASPGIVAGGPVPAPMPGTITVVDVSVGEAVRAGRRLFVVEAMKMEHPVMAATDGVVAAVHVAVGERVALGEPLALLQPDDTAAGGGGA